QNLARQVLDLIDALGNLHAAALAASAGMDLCLDDPHGPAELLRGFHRLLHRERGNAARHGHTKLAQDVLALVFVNLHEVSLRDGTCVRRGCERRETGSGVSNREMYHGALHQYGSHRRIARAPVGSPTWKDGT